MIHFNNLSMILLALSLTMTKSALSALPIKTFKVINEAVTFSLPDEWQSVNKEVGVPLKMMGPEYEEVRPIITLTPIDMKNEVIKLNDKKDAELSYKTSRLVWLQKFNGKALSFEPIKVYKSNNNYIHEFGMSYAFNDTNYSERSLYIECSKKIFHVKTLIKLEHLKKWNDEVSKITNSFQCKASGE